MSTEHRSPHELIVLMASLPSGADGATAATLVKRAAEFGGLDTSVAETAANTLATIEVLRERGDLNASRVKGARALRYSSTTSGRRHLEDRFGKLPAKVSWSSLRDRYLVMSILGMSSKAAPTFGLIRSLLLAQALEQSAAVANCKTESDVLNRLAALAAAASRPDPTIIKRAIVRNWLTEATRQPPAERSQTAVTSTEAFDFPAFARAVKEAAATSHGGRHGSKVFINHVWAALGKADSTFTMSQHDFGRALLEANRLRLLSLSRADLSPSLPTQDIEASELTWHGDTFHFVETER